MAVILLQTQLCWVKKGSYAFIFRIAIWISPLKVIFFPLISQLHLLLVHLVIFNFQFSPEHTQQTAVFTFCALLDLVPSLSSLVSPKLLCCFPLACDLLWVLWASPTPSDNLLHYSALFGLQAEDCCVRGLQGRWGTSAGKVFLSVRICYVLLTVANLPC